MNTSVICPKDLKWLQCKYSVKLMSILGVGTLQCASEAPAMLPDISSGLCNCILQNILSEGPIKHKSGKERTLQKDQILLVS